MAIQRVTEAERVEVGRTYLVPCVRVGLSPRRWLNDVGAGWLPVIGPSHTDADVIGFAPEHYHYDWRFMSSAVVERLTGYVLDKAARMMGNVEHGRPILEREWRRRRCLREMPRFPGPGTATWLHKLEPLFAGARLKPDCRTCPHRGLPLNGLPVVDGAVVCPGHGLRWDISTGALVRRVLEHP